MRPLQDFVLVTCIETEAVTPGGLILAPQSTDANTFARGRIESIGPGMFSQSGQRMSMGDLRVGMIVAYSKQAAKLREDSVPKGMALVREGEIYMDMTPAADTGPL